MKKLICVFMSIIVMLSSFCGCTDAKINLQYQAYYERMFMNFHEYSFTADLEVSAQTAPEEMVLEVNKVNEELLDFLNKAYHLEWELAKVEVYYVDSSYMGNFAAMADPIEGCIYINKSLSDEGIKYHTVHELIHMLRYNNVGAYHFVLGHDDMCLGYYTGEALTDLVASKYFEYKENSRNAYNYFLEVSQYAYGMTSCKILEYSIPEICRYYLINDIGAFQEKFNTLANENLNLEPGIDYFQEFLNDNDLILNATEYLYNTQDDYMYTIISNCMLGTLELSVALSAGIDNPEDAIKEVRYLFFIEGTSDDCEWFIRYLEKMVK